MKILGIDPGTSGALAFLTLDNIGQVTDLVVMDMPVTTTRTTTKKIQSWVNTPELARVIREHDPSHAIIEQVNAMPGQGVVSMFRFGHSLGAVMGVLGALQIPVDTITSPNWKKITRTPSAPDDASRHRAIQLFPWASKDFALKKHHGRADAALIAWAWNIRGA